MSTFRTIEQIFAVHQFHWVGNAFHVLNFFPQAHALANRLSPFLLLDYAPKAYFEPSEQPRGVGPHPHRGFETVTIAYQGAVSHHDSANNSGNIFAGDVQWMTAGRGILHKEYHEQAFSRAGGDFQMVQLWVDLPKVHKMIEPRYQTLLKSSIPVIKLPNNAGYIRVIAGNYENINGAAQTYSPLGLFDIRLNPHADTLLNFNPQYNTALLILDGALQINQQIVTENQLIVFHNEAGQIHLSTSEQTATLLVMSGEPLHQPIVQHGPFVMNSADEIQQALQDYNAGKFGQLAD